MLLDLRVVDSDLRKQFLHLLNKECKSRENKNGVSIDIQEVAFSKYVEMDKQLNSLIQDCAKIRGLSAIHMDSGAGHDTAHLAKFIPACLIFIPCHNGHSHCPEEFAEIDDIVNGANVIETAILKMASQQEVNVNED
jgi:N-carbamoyl-L-amino-acid hydrolase